MIPWRAIAGRVPYLTPGARASAARGVLVVVFVPAPWPWVVAGAWFAVWAIAVARDLARTPRTDEVNATRTLPLKFSIGVPNAVRIGIANRSARPAAVTGRDTPPASFSGTAHFGPVLIGPMTEGTVTAHLTPTRRGAFSFGAVALRLIGPLGLAGWQFALPLAEECRVYPDITAVRRFALMARRGALHEIGIRAQRYAGAGTEYESLREYQADDDYRDIDWKATARRGRPVVRQFEVERSQTMVIAIDAGRLMLPLAGSLPKLDRAINAALLLAYLGLEAGDVVGLLVFGKDVKAYLPPRRGHRQFLAITEALAVVEGRLEEPDYRRAFAYLTKRVGKRALVVLFTDLVGLEPSRRLLGVLATLAPRHLLLVVTQRNRGLESRARAEPRDEPEAFSAAVAEDIAREKAEALGMLAARGTLVVDVHPEELSVAAVNRYLEVKARGRL
jgi:uncharacterized protein (DUF58 family)